MSRYTGPSCKLCRREGTKLFLKGERCVKAKCAIDRGRQAPGMRSQRRSKLSVYGEQLRAKQQIKRSYGLTEKQFKLTFGRAAKSSQVTSKMLLILLELRLDNVIFRLGMAASRTEARQMVNHGHVKVNGRKVNISSFTVSTDDVISVKSSDRSKALVKKNLEAASSRVMPEWLDMDVEALKGRVLRQPESTEIQVPADEQMVVELYSK